MYPRNLNAISPKRAKEGRHSSPGRLGREVGTPPRPRARDGDGGLDGAARCRGHATATGVVEVRARADSDKSSKQGPSLSGSWQQGHSAAYSTPFPIQVVCKGFIARGQEIAVAHGSCDTAARGFPRAVDRLPSGMDSNLEAFLYYRDSNGCVSVSHLHSKLKIFNRLLHSLMLE